MRGFEHVEMSDIGYTGQRMLNMELAGRRKRVRPQRSIKEVLKEDVERVGVTKQDASNRVSWRQMISCGDP